MDTRDERDMVLRALNCPNIRAEIAKILAEEMDRSIEGVKYYVLPGGIAPRIHTGGSVGYDLHARAIVHRSEKDPNNEDFRKTIFDFHTLPDDKRLIQHNVVRGKDENGKERLGWRIHEGESYMVGVGIAFYMPPTLFQWVAPRSGLASKRITIANAPGTIDSDYRGEAGVLIVNESESQHIIHHGDRIAQLLFQRTVFPPLEEVKSHDELGKTERGAGGFGSTGYGAHKG